MAETRTPPVTVPITLDGVQFEYAGETELVRREPSRSLGESAGGAVREHRTLWGEPMVTYPDHLVPTQRRVLEMRIVYAHLRGRWFDLVEDLLAVPGVHELAPWRPQRCTWLGDGSATKLWAPWRRADELLTVPSPLASRTDPVVKIARTGDPLDVVSVDTETFDDSADPDPGEVWWEAEGQRLRLPSAPDSGVYVYARWYPLLRVYEATEDDRRNYGGQRPLAEPRSLYLVEAS